MNVAYVCNFLGPGFLDKYCSNKSFSISATLKSTALIRAFLYAGYKVTVFSPGITVCKQFIKKHEETINYPEGTVRIIYSHMLSYRKMSFINSGYLKTAIKKANSIENFDIFLYYNITLDAALNLHLFKEKIRILEYEDNIFNKALRGNKNSGEWLKKYLFEYVINRTDASIIVGKNMLKYYDSLVKVNIPGAINEDVLDSIDYDLKSWDGVFPVRISLAGGVHYSKGADLIIKALDYIDFPVELNFYGSGSFDNYTANLLLDCPQRHSVINNGYVAHKDLIKILSNESHILINSTRNMGVELNSEGYPFKMLEYAATGRPIVSSTIGRLDDDFNKNISFYDTEDPKDIADAIIKVVKNYSTFCEYAFELQKRVVSEFTVIGISKKIEYFISQINKNNGC